MTTITKNDVQLITQLDYIKVLLEENRYGEASDLTSELSKRLDEKVHKIAEDIKLRQLNLPKYLTKTKANEWVIINENWYKVKKVSKTEIILELNRQFTITKVYTYPGTATK